MYMDIVHHLTYLAVQQREKSVVVRSWPNRKGMPPGLTALGQLSETMQYCVWTRDDLTAVVFCRDTQDVQILINMHHSLTNCNFCDAYGNGIKQVTVHSTTNIWVILTEGTGCWTVIGYSNRYANGLLFFLDMTVPYSFLFLAAFVLEAESTPGS
jgi:hypothetical protein